MYVKMKSRKFKAVLAAVSAIAVLATAMTGFAATITTVTTYNIDNPNKASVTTTVALEGNSKDAEVTLLVSAPGAGVNGSGISYIDQKAASDGTAVFTYQLDKAALSDATAAVVTSGNDAGEAVTGSDRLGVTVLDDVTESNYTITYSEEAYGAGDGQVTAVIAAVGDNEIESITIGGVPQELGLASYNVPVNAGVLATVAVTTAPKTTTAGIANEGVIVDNSATVKKVTTVIKVNGAQTGYEIGVGYKGYTFPAAGTVNEEGYIAVVLENDVDFIAADISAYCVPVANNN